MSPRSSNPRGRRAGPAPADVYVALLFVSVAALCVGIGALVLELQRYDFAMAAGL